MILVFKTSVKNKKQIKKLKPHLNKILKKSQWNFDLEDCDKILRVDNKNCLSGKIIEILKNQDFECSELD